MTQMKARDYRRLSDDQLVTRWKQLDRDTSAMTMEDEVGRMFAMQEIGEVLTERSLWERTR